MDWSGIGTDSEPAERWHTDHTNREKPPAATILYGVEIPSRGGGTSVANMRVAYDMLPEDEQARLRELRTVNMLDEHHKDVRPEDMEKFGKPIVHPMVRTHPVHGSPAVYFHITKTRVYRGHDAGRQPRLSDRSAGPYDPARDRLHHQWRKGDVLVIDDRATMHRAHGDYDRSESRILWRIIVEGDRPVLM